MQSLKLAGLLAVCVGVSLAQAQAPSSSSSAGSSSSASAPAPPPNTPPSVQQPQGKPAQQAIRVEVNEVIVPVSVTDSSGRFVADLDQKDFQVLEDDKPQHIQFFTRERNQPVVIGFLVDLSSASRIHWKNYQEAAIELVQTLLTDDKKFSGYLVTYGQDAELQVNTTSEPE